MQPKASVDQLNPRAEQPEPWPRTLARRQPGCRPAPDGRTHARLSLGDPRP